MKNETRQTDVNFQANTRCADFFFFFLFLIFRSADEISTKISKVWTVFNVRYKISISISRWVEHVRDSRLDLESELHSDLENSTSRVMIIA